MSWSLCQHQDHAFACCDMCTSFLHPLHSKHPARRFCAVSLWSNKWTILRRLIRYEVFLFTCQPYFWKKLRRQSRERRNFLRGDRARWPGHTPGFQFRTKQSTSNLKTEIPTDVPKTGQLRKLMVSVEMCGLCSFTDRDIDGDVLSLRVCTWKSWFWGTLADPWCPIPKLLGQDLKAFFIKHVRREFHFHFSFFLCSVQSSENTPGIWSTFCPILPFGYCSVTTIGISRVFAACIILAATFNICG